MKAGVIEITQQVRDYAAKLNDPAGAGVSGASDAAPFTEGEASAGSVGESGSGGAAPLTEEERQKGMAEMSEKFRAIGGQVYVADLPGGPSDP